MRFRVFIAMLCAVAVVAPATAARQSDLVLKSTVVKDFATCLMRNARASSVRFLNTDPGSKAEREQAGWLVSAQGACLKGRRVLSFTPAAIHGALAEVAFDRDPALLRAAAALPETPAVRVEPGLKEARFVPAYAGCLAKAAPGKVSAILQTPAGSREESAATLALGDRLTQCMATDIAYHLDLDALRPQLAAALYHIVPNGLAGA